MNRNEHYLKRIVGTLKYGWFDGKASKKNLLYGIIVCLFVVGFVLLGIILACKDEPFSERIIFIVIGGIVMMSAPIALFIVYLINEKRKKEIRLWLNDAVELCAHSTKIRTKGVILPAYQIRIEFGYDGKRYKKFSGGINEGCDRVWSNYLDKQISILYSPSYDEVMVLKSK